MKCILLRFGELYLKGNNRYIFENKLIENVKKSLSGIDFKFVKTFGRYVITDYELEKQDEIVSRLKTVFGLYSLSIADEVESNKELIIEKILNYNVSDKTFKVFVKRADKTFPLTSMELARQIGEKILEKYPTSKVDLYNPFPELPNGNTPRHFILS